MEIPKIILNNFFTRHSLEQIDDFPMNILSKRLQAMVADLSFSMVVFFPLFLLLIISFFIVEAFSLESEPSILSPIAYVLMLVWQFVLLNKDIANGMSAGKRTFGFKIIDFKTKQEASQMQCMLRNVTMFVWPLEVLVTAFNSKRRIGDLIAGTEVVEWEKHDLESLREDLELIEKMPVRVLITSSVLAVLLIYLQVNFNFIFSIIEIFN
ncbi:hypothetical protein EYV94_21330 [Puteibacter caeruleilacunae]|nr:hypothetical protein EYV94_21330 [Puteibacter caeruleilacunae]